MFSDDVLAIIPEWKAKKQAQWEVVKDALPGLQIAVSGNRGTQFMLTVSTHDGSFYESVVFGQLPQIVLEEYGSKFNRRLRDMAEDKKPIDAKAIDLSDHELALVIDRWRKRMSARDLPFVRYVVGPNGQRQTK